MLDIEVTDRWRSEFPGGQVGVLLIGNVTNTSRQTNLDPYKKRLKAKIREKFEKFSRADLLELEQMKAYRKYYKAFNKTYHVQLQLESIAHKNKSLPSVSPLVDANFCAEMKTLILTAGHDADLLNEPVRIDASQGGEILIQMNGAKKTLKPNDMMMCDAKGVVCTVIYGQDQRTAISLKTCRAFYVSYVPAGISTSTVSDQLEQIKRNIYRFSPEAKIELMEIYHAHP